MQNSIQLIVGLGNPGQQYQMTRHNAGAWCVEMLAHQYNVALQLEPKFQARIGQLQLQQKNYWLLIPMTYMNKSGLAIKLMTQFYKIPTTEILVAHDELDFPPGIVKFKQDGGHGGHNGLRDIIAHLKHKNFHRLRIGIGHPGNRDQVVDYVLNKPSKTDYSLIMDAIHNTQLVLPTFLAGNFQQAIHQLHNLYTNI